MAHLVFNSFPRSGNVFISSIAGHAFSMEMSAVHLPEILGVPDLCNVVVFRKPEDAISSLVNKTREHSTVNDEEGALNVEYISHIVRESVEGYTKYLTRSRLHLDNIQIVLFEDLIEDYETVFNGIANKFSLDLNAGYQSKVDIQSSEQMWSNKYDGHAPRERDTTRLELEALIGSMDIIKELNDKYFEFLSIL